MIAKYSMVDFSSTSGSGHYFLSYFFFEPDFWVCLKYHKQKWYVSAFDTRKMLWKILNNLDLTWSLGADKGGFFPPKRRYLMYHMYFNYK